jgi:glutamyl-tRNA synthetase
MIISEEKSIVTRFPPSPTGNLHIGGARTALFNFLFARHCGGKLYLRLENTDEARSKPEYEKNIHESLEWLGIHFNELPDGKSFWRQSERKEVYRAYLQKMVESGSAYVSKEEDNSPRSDKNRRAPFIKGELRKEVIRFRNPNKKIVFDDLIRGAISFDTTELGDFVIAKSLQEPLYHLAVVIDDYEMGVTHIIRGEDHISNTPRQILLQEAFQFPRPEYAHIPLILAPDRSKLSKRHGAVSVTEYRDKGYFPEAVVNYLALLGWNPGTAQEIFSLDELVNDFDLSKAQKGGAVFNEEKLRWFNKEYLKMRGGAEQMMAHIPDVLSKGRGVIQLRALSEMLFERSSVFGDIQAEVGLQPDGLAHLGKGEFEYLHAAPQYQKTLLKWEKATSEPLRHIEKCLSLLQNSALNSFTREDIRNVLMSYANEAGKGNVLWPMRVALSGREKSPDPFTLAAILGKEETLARLKTALAMLK